MQFLIAGLILLSTSYGAMTGRHIKALSDDDIKALHEGAGMGYALAAELNHYPGPKHVLELADRLQLTAEQKAGVQKAHDEMKSTAVRLGNEIIQLERALDQAFAATKIDQARLRQLIAAIADRQGQLRYAHLAAHLKTRAVLAPEQVTAYDAARGYDSPGATHQHSHH